MPTYLELPKDRTPTCLADWIELNALIDTDGSVSRQDLLSILTGESEPPEKDQITSSQQDDLTDDAFGEIQRRVRSAGGSYPFFIDKEKVVRKEGKYTPYIFCLLVAFYGVEERKLFSEWKKDEISKCFEELSELSIKNLLNNNILNAESCVFGWPRKWDGKADNPKFKLALHKLCTDCKQMKPKDRIIAQVAKDAGLDIVCWKTFPDKMLGGILFLGQCATGSNWTDKLSDIKKFTFFIDQDRTEPITGTFIPHMPDISDIAGEEKWIMHIQRTGLLFNRCRIALLANNQWNDKWADKMCKKALKAIYKQAIKKYLTV